MSRKILLTIKQNNIRVPIFELLTTIIYHKTKFHLFVFNILDVNF